MGIAQIGPGAVIGLVALTEFIACISTSGCSTMGQSPPPWTRGLGQGAAAPAGIQDYKQTVTEKSGLASGKVFVCGDNLKKKIRSVKLRELVVLIDLRDLALGTETGLFGWVSRWCWSTVCLSSVYAQDQTQIETTKR